MLLRAVVDGMNEQLGMYYNTTGQRGDELHKRLTSAKSQDKRLLAFFEVNHQDCFTADEIHERVFPNSPRTSAGRSLNTLMQLGYVLKLAKQVTGQYGAPVHLWCYNNAINKLGSL